MRLDVPLSATGSVPDGGALIDIGSAAEVAEADALWVIDHALASAETPDRHEGAAAGARIDLAYDGERQAAADPQVSGSLLHREDRTERGRTGGHRVTSSVAQNHSGHNLLGCRRRRRGTWACASLYCARLTGGWPPHGAPSRQAAALVGREEAQVGLAEKAGAPEMRPRLP
jgi:hypothetical protein